MSNLCYGCRTAARDGYSKGSEDWETKMMSHSRRAVLVGSVLMISLSSWAFAASRAAAADAPDPRPGTVLEDIYGEKGDGSASYALAPYNGGHVVSFWYGYHFKVAGQKYYTAFTVLEPTEGSTTYDGFLFGQMTYRLDTIGDKSSWTIFHGQRVVAEVHGSLKADKIDDSRKAKDYVTSNQHLVVAIPTSHFEAGETINTFTIFAFDPAKNDLGDYRSWDYLGAVAAGGENSANCGEGLPVPCVSSTGALFFAPPVSGKMPDIRVNLAGTQVDGPGKIKTLGPTDAITYRFNRAKGQYEGLPAK